MTLVFKCFNVHRIYSPTKPIADSMLPISIVYLIGITFYLRSNQVWWAKCSCGAPAAVISRISLLFKAVTTRLSP